MSFGILHAVKVAVITRQGHIGYGTSLILIVALILYIKVVGRSRDNEDERNFNYSAKGTYGTSRIATEEEYKSYLSITDSALETDGIILGTTMDEKVVSIPRDSPYNRNLFVAGSQGSFKSMLFPEHDSPMRDTRRVFLCHRSQRGTVRRHGVLSVFPRV